MAAAALTLLSGCYTPPDANGPGYADDSPDNPRWVRRFGNGLIESSSHRPVVTEAVRIVNTVVDDNVSFRLRTTWDTEPQPRRQLFNLSYNYYDYVNTNFRKGIGIRYTLRGTASDRELVNVYLVEADNPGKHGVSFVPEGARCIFVDADALGSIERYTVTVDGLKLSGTLSETTERALLLAFLLLHEMGHITIGHWGRSMGPDGTPRVEFNLDLNDSKKRELDADMFAQNQIKKAYLLSLDPNKFIPENDAFGRGFAAILLRSTADSMLTKVSLDRMQTAEQIIQFAGIALPIPDNSRNKELLLRIHQQLHSDNGYSHPNLEYRMLRILDDGIYPEPNRPTRLEQYEAYRKRVKSVKH